MAELRDVVRRLKFGHAVRDIQRSTGVHRTIIRELRRLAEENEWLIAESALPTEELIQSVRSGAIGETNVEHQLDAHYDEIENWVKDEYSCVVMHVLIRDRVACSESTLRRYIKRRFPGTVEAVMRRATIAGQIMEVDFGYLGITYDVESGRNRRTHVFSGRLRHSPRAWREYIIWNSPELMDTKLAPYSMGEGTYGRDTK